MASPLHEQQNIHELEACAVIINKWMHANTLKMNTSKTEYIMFGSNAQHKKCVATTIDIAGDVVHHATCIIYLGAFLDETLTFKEHVKRKCRTAMLNVFRIKNIRKY